MSLSTVKGFNKLNKEQQILFIKVNTAHMKAVENKQMWTPVHVMWDKSYFKVTFANGEWLHYTKSGTWY